MQRTPLSSRSHAPTFIFDPSAIITDRDASHKAEKAPEDIAMDVVAQARLEAESIIKDARRRVAAFLETAYEEGYSLGQNQAVFEWKQTMEDAADAAELAEHQIDRITPQLEEAVVKLACSIAEKVVRHEVTQLPDTILEVIRLGLRQIKDRSRVIIRVNARDLDRVRKARAEIASWAEGVRDLEFVEEPRVEPGGAIIESTDGVLDARITSQLKEIQTRLLEQFEQ